MAIVHFDGFDTYAVVPAGETTVGANASTALTAAGWSGTGISTTTATRHQIMRPAASFFAEPRNWLSPTQGSTNTVNTSAIADPCRIYVNTAPGAKAVVGFKYAAMAAGSATYAYIGRLTLENRCVELHYATGSGQITLSTTIDSNNTPTVVTLANQIVKNGGGLSNGTSSAFAGSVFASTFTKDAVNTVELEVDPVNDTATCWINNLYVGTVQCPAHSTYTVGDHTAMFQIGTCGFRGGTGSGGITVGQGAITDLYIVDGSGDANNSRLGKVKVLTRVPAADVQAQLDRPANATTNSEVVSQIPPSSSNYLTGVGVDDTDLYSGLAFDFSNEAILATAVTVSGFKTDPAGNNISPVISVEGEVFEMESVALPVGASYSTRTVVQEKNPKTGLPFTKSTLDSTNFGVRVKAAE